MKIGEVLQEIEEGSKKIYKTRDRIQHRDFYISMKESGLAFEAFNTNKDKASFPKNCNFNDYDWWVANIEVPFDQAIIAWTEGKQICCKVQMLTGERTYYENATVLLDITKSTVKEGRWYIV